jgi:hypothetical protein
MEPRLKKKTAPRKRSLAVWIIYLGFAWLAFSGFVRMIDSIISWYWYTMAGIQPGPLYLAISGGLWGLCGLFALVWLWFGGARGRKAASAAAVFYAVTFWLDRLLVSRLAASNHTFPALLTLLGLAYILLVLRPWEKTADKMEPSNDKKRTGN